jgi:SAM-dependent methyltransferase
MHSFGQSYAANYDLFYTDKDYGAECDLLEAAFEQYADGSIRSILDLGCGTGGHAFPLAARGYRVTGVDRSSQMLQEAERKRDLADAQVAPEFHLGDIGDLRLRREFDAALMMFAVLGYQSADPDLAGALKTVRTHLRSGGLFLGDFWYGPAVLAIGPTRRELKRAANGGELIRTATPQLDLDRHLCTVSYELYESDGDTQSLIDQESHTMRYFFRNELTQMLDSAGMELLALHPFPELEGSPDESTWNAWYCARAR